MQHERGCTKAQSWGPWVAVVVGLAVGCDPAAVDFDALGELIESSGGTCDGDGDGARALRCGGDDCDDGAAAVHPGAAEGCEGRDDDCDGVVDEGLGLGAGCVAFEGACRRAGVLACSAAGAVVCDAVSGAPSDEACNGVDDDCDGSTDEGFGVGVACEVGVGRCRAAGVTACDAAGVVGCVGEPGAAAVEVCDGVDDDCDGAVDEGVGPGALCAAGVGRCRREAPMRCAGGEWVCEAEPGPALAEVCNGADEDCDRVVDEGLGLGEECGVGAGACRAEGVMVCGAGGAVVCGAQAGAPGEERCDGVDNDCDGIVDERFDVGAVCVVGLGVCAATGRLQCAADGGVVCDAAPGVPGVERCDGIDNDCDFAVDETFTVVLGRRCSAGVGACRADGVEACGPDGGVVCNAAVGAPAAEGCDGVDNDCDGVIDEGLPVGEVCVTGQGACLRRGRWECGAVGALRCDVEPGEPRAEVCNGVDDDCDFWVDEGLGLDRGCVLGLGACAAAGRTVCAPDGAVICDTEPGRPGEERCGGGDEDCDGTVDEGLGLGEACAVGVGACRVEGVAVCRADGGVECDAVAGVPGVERCDGIDGDCDGSIDEGLGLGEACAVGLGACRVEGVAVCGADGGVECDAVAGVPGVERCDGVDDDCDGSTDEGLGLGEVCAVGVGACRVEGVAVCGADGGVVCDARAGVAGVERCDGVDDDCDGSTDEGLGLGEACAVGFGLCAAEGVRVCGDGGGVVCDAVAEAPEVERCDGVDNDCDDAVDETFAVVLGRACAVGVGACRAVGVEACGDDGGLVCDAVARAAGVEVCGGGDADCDGRVDEGVCEAGDCGGVCAEMAYGTDVCMGGGCRRGCLFDGDCLHGQLCDVAAGMCVVLAPQAVTVEPTPGELKRLGANVAVAGGLVAMGSPYADHEDGRERVGGAWVFERARGWLGGTRLEPLSPESLGLFGSAVAVAGESVFVAMPEEDGDAESTAEALNRGAVDSGAVYVFSRGAGGEWTRVEYLKAPDAGSRDYFGSDLAVAGETVFIGARLHDGDARSTLDAPNDGRGDSGAVYVAERGPDGWRLVDILKAPDAPRYGRFGQRLSASPGRLAVCGDDEVHVFEQQADGTWQAVAVVERPEGAPVAIHGDVLVVGDPEARGQLPLSGAAWVYERQADGSWPLVDVLAADPGGFEDGFGSTVAVTASRILVGAPFEDGGRRPHHVEPSDTVDSSGAVYAFERRAEGWVQSRYIKPEALQTLAEFGGGLAATESTLVVGAPAAQPGSFGPHPWLPGVMHVFDLSLAFEGASCHPAARAPAVEVCDGVDGDCDGWVDEDFDVRFDLEHCGGCGRVCGGATPGVDRCVYGQCRRACMVDDDCPADAICGVGARAGYCEARDGYYLKAPIPNFYFGMALSVSGGTLAVGSYDAGDAESTLAAPNTRIEQSGAVFVFDEQPSGRWALSGYLKASNPGSLDGLGLSVALDGDRVVAGARFEDGDAWSTVANPNEGESQAGAAYVFDRGPGGEWAQVAYLKASNADGYDRFGTAVAIEGDVVVVGAPEEDSSGEGVLPDEALYNAGAAYVFERDAEGVWRQTAYLKPPYPTRTGMFGAAVAVRDGQVYVGSPDDPGSTESTLEVFDPSLSGSGAVYVFGRAPDGGWVATDYIKAPNAGRGDAFGGSIAVSAQWLVVGATREGGGPASTAEAPDDRAASAGAAYVFARDGEGAWAPDGYLKSFEPMAADEFGVSVAVHGDAVVVGSAKERGSAESTFEAPVRDAQWAGAAFLFERTAAGWALRRYAKAGNAERGDELGGAVAIGDGVFLAGATREGGDVESSLERPNDYDPNAGAVYVFEF